MISTRNEYVVRAGFISQNGTLEALGGTGGSGVSTGGAGGNGGAGTALAVKLW